MDALEIQSAVQTSSSLPRGTATEVLSDERRLVTKAKLGHCEALGELYRRHQQKAYCAAFRILRNVQDAEDAVQRAFQRVLVNLERFREDSSFSTWLTRIAINEALMLLRTRRTREPLFENNWDPERGQVDLEVADDGPTPEEIFSEVERRTTLLQAIAKLRRSLRVVVQHRELQGLTNAETAKRLGLTVNAVKARTFHARRVLKKHFERKFAGTGVLMRLQKESRDGS